MDNNRMVQEEEDSIDLLEIFELLKQNWVIIVLSAIIAAVTGFVATKFFATPKYEASGMLIVNARANSNASNPSGTYDASVDNINSAAKLAALYSIIVKSDKVLDEVREDLALDYTFEELYGLVSVSSVNDTQIMRVTVTTEDVNLSREICASILKIAPEKIKDAAEAGSVKVVSDARPNESPVSPHVMRDTAIMGILGIVLSIGIIVVAHLFDNKINSENDVEKYLGMTVIGVIPYFEKETTNGK